MNVIAQVFLFRHATNPGEGCASGEVKQDCLGLIVGGVSGEDPAGANLKGSGLESPVSGVARPVHEIARGRDVDPNRAEGDVEPLGQGIGQGQLARGLGSETMIDPDRGQVPEPEGSPELGQAGQEGLGVGAAADRDHHPGPRREPVGAGSVELGEEGRGHLRGVIDAAPQEV